MGGLRFFHRFESGCAKVVVNIEQSVESLLSHRKSHEIPDFNNFFLAEIFVQAIPECIVCIQVPGDRFGQCQRSFSRIVIEVGLFKIQQFSVLAFR